MICHTSISTSGQIHYQKDNDLFIVMYELYSSIYE